MAISDAHTLLRDLALVYLALAHATDEELGDAERDALAQRLQARHHNADGNLQDALNEAIERYEGGEAPRHVKAAVDHLRQELPEADRRRVLDDLTDIALADDAFLFLESSFIGEVARAWHTQPSRTSGIGEASWSLLPLEDGGSGDGVWTPIHDLAFLYLTLAEETDGKLKAGEIEAITTKLGEWVPDAGYDDVLQVVKDALLVTLQGPDRRTYDEAVDAVRRAVPEHQRQAVLDDLDYIAHADGRVLETEADFVNRLADAWDLQAGMQPDGEAA